MGKVRLGEDPNVTYDLDPAALKEQGYAWDSQKLVLRGPDGRAVPDVWGSTEEEALQSFSKAALKDKRRQELSAGLNAEGDAMGHCVGGYCDDVASRGTEIYSLRDAKNNPHVTVEVRPKPVSIQNLVAQITPAQRAKFPRNIDWQRPENLDGDVRVELYNAFPEAVKAAQAAGPLDVLQIKGKQNAAPVAKYLPYVQDFVKSGQWGRVGDLKNTGLETVAGRYLTRKELDDIGKAHYDMPPGALNAEYLDNLARKTPEALSDVDRNALTAAGLTGYAPGTPGYAHGGTVAKFSKKAALLARLNKR